MYSTGKAAHICTKFRKDDFSAAPSNSRQFINCCYGGLVFCHMVLDHSAQRRDPLIQIINMIQNLGKQFMLQRGYDTLCGCHELCQL